MEKGVPFEEEKQEITPWEDMQDWAAFEAYNIEHLDSQDNERIVQESSDLDLDVSPGVASLGTEVPHPTQARRTRFPEQDVPGASSVSATGQAACLKPLYVPLSQPFSLFTSFSIDTVQKVPRRGGRRGGPQVFASTDSMVQFE